jgi:hypothetical protein
MIQRIPFAFIIFFFVTEVSLSQVSMNNSKKLIQDLTFNGSQLNPYDMEKDSSARIQISGYIDTYYAHYSDTSSFNNFQKFPTTSPRNNAFALNIAQISAKYQSENVRGIMTLFWGDVPKCIWSPRYNMIQEANIGVKLYDKLWLDVGFFRTHMGIESIQPRENMTLSTSVISYFEPYYLSGAKLSYEFNSKLTLQANIFNGFNNFIEDNSNKALGLSMVYQANKHLTITVSHLLSEETPGKIKGNKTRLYNNIFATYKRQRISIGAEFNYGIQDNTIVNESRNEAMMYSGLIVAKFRHTYRWASYVRGEYFSDLNEMLTGPNQLANDIMPGLQIGGFTCGIEFKPIPNSYIRLEGRGLSSRKNEQIFQLQENPSSFRYEFLSGIGLWF